MTGPGATREPTWSRLGAAFGTVLLLILLILLLRCA
jgi:hypothetical protein